MFSCAICGAELKDEQYVRSTFKKGVKYCLPGEGCWTRTKDEPENEPTQAQGQPSKPVQSSQEEEVLPELSAQFTARTSAPA